MRDKSLLKQILEATRDVWDRPGTRPAVRKNFTGVLDCGTRALGWEVYASDTEAKRCYHRIAVGIPLGVVPPARSRTSAR
jgi:hypothetical protein